MYTLTPWNIDTVASMLGAKTILVRGGGAILFKTTQWSYDLAVPGDTVEPTADGYVRVVRRKND